MTWGHVLFSWGTGPTNNVDTNIDEEFDTEMDELRGD